MDVTQNESPSVDFLLYCRACLSTHGRLFNIHEYKLADAFAHITGIYVDQDQLPQSLCVYCGTQLLKSASFRNMCLHTQQSLTLELVKEKHCMEDIHKINTSNPFLDLTLTEIQTIECIDIAPADTAIECMDIAPADTAIECIDIAPADTAIECIDIAPADTAIECIDIAPADTAIECSDTPATDTNMDCIDTTDIDLPLNDFDPEDINITLEPNLDFADVALAMRRNNPNAKSTDSKYEYKNKTVHNNILKTNVKSVVKKTDTKIADENLKQVLNANNDLRKPSVKLNQIDSTIEITDTKMKDSKKKLNIKKGKIKKPNVKFVGVDGIIKKTDSKVEYENQKQVLNISKDKLQYIKSRMRTIGYTIKKNMETAIGESSGISIPGDIKINIETKNKFEVNGVSDVKIIRMPIKLRQEKLRETAALKKKIDMKIMMKSKSRDIKRNPENNYLPVFDFAKFESDYKVEIVTLSKEEQLEEIAARKKSQNSFQCEICGKGFNMESTYINHRTRHNPSEGAFSCEICSIRFQRDSRRQKHQDTHRLKFICNSCGFVSRQKDQAKKHHAMHEGKTFQCHHCGKTFLKSTSYFSHVRLAHPTKNVICSQCGETFISPLGLRQHQKLTHTKKPQQFKCTVCSANFNSVEALNRHTDTAAEHGALRPCEQCGENCASEEALREHVKETHPKETYRCEECDMSFQNASAFDTHSLRKHLGKRYAPAAAACPRNYSRGRTLVCDQCGRFMMNAALLRYHLLRVHQNVKPFVCNECPKRFFNKPALQVHMRSHTGERPYPCPACPRAFSVKKNLKRHYLTAHEGIRDNIPCGICGRVFTTKGSMEVHVSTVHCGRPWPKRNRPKRPESSSTKMTHDKNDATNA